MPNYERSYYDLESCSDKLFSLIDKSISEGKIINIRNLWGDDGHFKYVKIGFGSVFFGLDIDDALLKFRSNRYFIDALKVDLLPSIDEWHEWTNGLQKSFDVKWTDIRDELHWVVSVFDGYESKPSVHIDFDSLDENGYLIVPGVLDLSLCDDLKYLTLSIADHERTSLARGYVYGSGKMQRIYSLISRHTSYQELLLNSVVSKVMNHMFYRETFHEKYYLTSFHANLLFPGCEKQIWHIDANVPEPLPPWIIRSNSNYIIDDYSREFGATELIPGSHKWMRKPNSQEAEKLFSSSEVRHIEAPKGSVAFWHGHLWHRSGANVTNKTRVALLGAYAASFFREVSMEENPFLNLDMNQVLSMDSKVKNLLGFHHGAKFYY